MSRMVYALLAGLVTAMAASLSTAAYADCTCVNKGGALYHLGERACISVGGNSYIAECQMNLNNTSWEKIEDGCPITSLSPGQRLQSDWVKAPGEPPYHS